MQNVLVHWNRITESQLYPVPYGRATSTSMVDLEDIAKVAAMVLTERRHDGAIYELCGPELLSQVEVANILSEKLNYPVQIKEISLSEWEVDARQRGMGDYQIKTLSRMFRYYDQYGFYGNPLVMASLLGQPASKFENFVDRMVRESI